MFIFEIGNLICAVAPSSSALIAGRAVTGLGASGVFVGGIVVLATIIPLHKRAIWQGTQVMMFSVASVVAPVIGGALTQSLTWRWCFWINLPSGGLSAVLLVAFLRIWKPAETTRMPFLGKLKALDFVGFVILAGSTAMLLLALQFGGNAYARSSSVIIGLFIGFAITILFNRRLADLQGRRCPRAPKTVPPSERSIPLPLPNVRCCNSVLASR